MGMPRAGLIVLLLPLLCAACGRDGGQQDFSGDLQRGDVVLRLGRGAKSRAVVQADQGAEYSHAGMVALTDSGLVVVHAVPGEAPRGEAERVKADSPEVFFGGDRATRGLVLRLADTAGAGRAADYCLRMLAAGVEFDHDYDLGDTTQMYCTELLWRAYMLSGVDITGGLRATIANFPIYSGTYIFPSHFIKGGVLQQVKFYPEL